MGTVSKLENILQKLTPLSKQGKVEGFFTNSKGADVLSGLVGDIHDAVVDYQVCNQSKLIIFTPDTCFRLHYSKISMKRAAHSL